MILLVASNKDMASQNIKEQILKLYPFKKAQETFQQNPIFTAQINNKSINLITINEESVRAQILPESFPNAMLIVFISRHSSKSAKPTLSVHTPGNIGAAGLGGLPRKVSISPAIAMRDALQALSQWQKKLNLDYEVSYECTHHGPSLNIPAMFIELGSSEPQWQDPKAAQAVAHATIASIGNFKATTDPAVLGIGGTHYNQKFTRMALKGKAVFGHMIPKYAISLIDIEIIRQCVEKTFESVSLAVLDWKGIKSEDKSHLLSMLQATGLSSLRV